MARDGDSIAVSIDIPRSTAQALLALRRTDGIAVALGDAEIAAARAALARREGLFVEASSAAAFAAVERLAAAGKFGRNDSVVAIATASGLKDTASSPARKLPAAGTDLDGLRRALKQSYGFDV